MRLIKLLQLMLAVLAMNGIVLILWVVAMQEFENKIILDPPFWTCVESVPDDKGGSQCINYIYTGQ